MKKLFWKVVSFSVFCFLLLIGESLGNQSGEKNKEGNEEKSLEPFAFADFSWLNGNNRQRHVPNLVESQYLKLDLYLDTYYDYSWNRPRDHTLIGSATMGRTNEFQVNLASIECSVNYQNAIGRLALQFGTQLSVVQERDPTVNRGQNLRVSDLKYIREVAVGYHWDQWYGINFEVGIFPSYIGLESYLTQENWNYQRSLPSDFTPFYFQGARVQIFPTRDLKIEPWLINGFQTYGKFREDNSLGLSVYYRPAETLALAANFYYGNDTNQNEAAKRLHHDNSVMVRYWDSSAHLITKAALSLNNHYGNEQGGGLSSSSNYFIGSAIANRIWFLQDRFAITLRGSFISNPGRYIVLPPGPEFRAWDYTATLDYMPSEVLTYRAEFISRFASSPFYAGADGTLETSEARATLAASFRM